MRAGRSAAWLLTALLLAAAVVSTASAAKKKQPRIPYRDQVHALYVMDHDGKNPVAITELLAYVTPFQKILGHCFMSVDALTNETLFYSAKASDLGARVVTNLDMLKSVARRITWRLHKGCGYIIDLAEGNLEAGHH